MRMKSLFADFTHFAISIPSKTSKNQRVSKLDPPDSHHLDAAIGWLGLGCVPDARDELENISLLNQSHPEALEARWVVCAHDEKWSEALEIARLELQCAPADPSGWLHQAYAMRRVANGSLSAAWDALLPAAEKFPDEPIIAYNLACYACQMQQLDAARVWLKRAIKIGGKDAIQKTALADDDLKPLWPEIEEL
jgi:tetratricopeptide (TPR) repeat protein